MSSPIPCHVLRSPGNAYAHTDVNRALSLFGVYPLQGATHELQLCEHDETVSWLLNDPPSPEESAEVAASGLKYLGRFSEANPRDATVGPVSDTNSTSVVAPTGSAIRTSSFSLRTFKDTSREKKSEVNGGGQVELREYKYSSMERQAKLTRYKEKKKRRRYGKQIRYAYRKAYAELKPRIKGRFAKTPNSGPPPPK